MINKEIIQDLVESKLAGTRYFLVDLSVSPENVIVVEIDSEEGVDVDFCVELSRFVEKNFDREVEDYELEVGSAGLTSPLKCVRQYKKYIGKEMEVLALSGMKYKGMLIEADEDKFVIEETVMERREGDKRKKSYTERRVFGYNEIKYTKYLINLK